VSLGGGPASRRTGSGPGGGTGGRLRDGAAPRPVAHPGRRRGAARHRWTLALTSGTLLVVAGRPWGLGWLALVAFVPLLRALRLEPSPARSALLVGVVAFGAACVAYEALGPVSPALLPLVAAAAALPFAAAGAMAPRLRRALGEGALAGVFPVLWLAAEWLPGRTWLLGRFASPLFAVGYSQAGLPTMQLARLGGVAAVSLAVLGCNALLSVALLDRRRWAWAALLALAALVAGVWRAAPPPASLPGVASPGARPAARLRVAQLALPAAAYAAAVAIPGAGQALVRSLVMQSRAVPLPAGPGLTVWPEGALPGPLPVAGPARLERTLQGVGPLLAGAPARTERGIANAAFAWDGDVLRYVYAKRRLVPVAEDDLVAGDRPGWLELGGLRVAPLICFEVAFPELTRQAALGGAQVLAVLTNDAFGRYLGTPLQHLRVARFRAVETGLPLAFASNGGPSAVIDGAGRVLVRSRIGRPETLVATPRLRARTTLYLRWGDWPGTLALAGSLLLALVAGARGGAVRT